MQMDHVELLLAKERFDCRIERHVECHAHSAAVGRNGYGPPDAVEPVAHFQAALAAARREHGHIMSLPHKLGTQMSDVLEHTAGMRRVVW
jgi:hypothetical protein